MRKLNQAGFLNHFLLVALAIVAVGGVVLVFNKVRDNGVTAKASSYKWVELPSKKTGYNVDNYGVKIFACQTKLSSTSSSSSYQVRWYAKSTSSRSQTWVRRLNIAGKEVYKNTSEIGPGKTSGIYAKTIDFKDQSAGLGTIIGYNAASFDGSGTMMGYKLTDVVSC